MKNTWEMDLTEYENSAEFLSHTDDIARYGKSAAAEILHRTDLLSALINGLQVPDNCLLDYPDNPMEFEHARIEGLYKTGRMVDLPDKPDYYKLYKTFLDNMSALQRGNVQNTLNLDVRYGDKVMSRRAYVEMVHVTNKQAYEFNATQQKYYEFLERSSP